MHPSPAFGAEQGQDDDARWISRALEAARDALMQDEVPVGAVIVRGGEILAAAGNRTVRDHDATAHAETQAIPSPFGVCSTA